VTDVRPREFLQLSDGSYVRVTSTADGELMPVEEPVKPQRARGGSASTAVAFSSHVVAERDQGGWDGIARARHSA
jgi:hypothetical protein